MRRPSYSTSPINFSAMTRKVDVDNRISLRNYYRIADNLLKQANIYREEKNLIDLYVILLRYSSLVSETIPCHKDYHVLCGKERSFYKKNMLAVLDELEVLKPKVRRQLDELEKAGTGSQMKQFDGSTSISYAPSVNNKASLNYSSKQMSQAITAPSSSLKQNNDYTRFSMQRPVESQFQKMSLGLPLPKEETLSRHSLLGPTGLRGQWLGPRAEVKMPQQKSTAKKQLYRGASTRAVLLAYHGYREVDGHTFDRFLTEYFRVWNHAYERGVATHFDGIMRLAEVAPLLWRGYAKEISGDYIYRQLPHYDYDGDLPRFVSRLRQVYNDYDGPPYGPYRAPREYSVRPPQDWLYQQPLVVVMPTVPYLQTSSGRFDAEAGPSRLRPLEIPMIPPPVTVPSLVPYYRSPVYGHRPVGYGVRLAERDDDSSSRKDEPRDIPMVEPPAGAEQANADGNDDDSEEEEDPEENPDDDGAGSSPTDNE